MTPDELYSLAASEAAQLLLEAPFEVGALIAFLQIRYEGLTKEQAFEAAESAKKIHEEVLAELGLNSK